MSELFQIQFRVSSTQLPDWDYCNPGFYFVTIYTQKHFIYFSEIRDEEMVDNKLGTIAKDDQLNPGNWRNEQFESRPMRPVYA